MAQLFRIILHALLLTLAAAQNQRPDQLGNFCRRFSQQTTVIDDKLFIDGGYIDYGGSITDYTVNYTNTRLLYADLSSVSDGKFPIQYNNLSKPPDVPSVAGGTLWADQVNKLFYLFGGETNWTAQVREQRTPYFYDALYNTWNTTSTDPSAEGVSPPAYGAGAVDNERGVGYYYGGWKSNATEYNYFSNATAQSGLITYDFGDNNWRTASIIDDTPRAEGVMFYIPASDAGMLVYFGGVQQAANGSYVGVPMDTIYLYDIGSQKGYTQRTSGTPPAMRRRFCGGVSWPDDRSSYNIYFYGGLQPYGEQGYGYGDAWILSIPSFTWTIWYNSTIGAHHSLSCDVVREGQMIVMGGYWPNSTYQDCDVPTIWGMHNMDLGATNYDQEPWWQYLLNITEYTVPANITAKIGGSSTGGATQVTPAIGSFDEPDLQVYLGRKAATGSRTPTRAIPSPTSTPTSGPAPEQKSSANVGAIAGGVVGGVVVLIALALGLCVCLRRRRRRREGANVTAPRPDTGAVTYQDAMSETPATASGYHASTHKREISSSSYPSSPGFSQHHSPSASPPPHSGQWQSATSFSQQNHFREDLPPQEYYAPPPQAQPFFPPPPMPQTYEQPSPTFEMPNVRSPTNVADLNNPGRWRASSAGAHNTINEE